MFCYPYIVDKNFPLCNIVHTQDQVSNRCLAGSCSPDYRDTLTRLDRQIDILKCLDSGIWVYECHILEFNSSTQGTDITSLRFHNLRFCLKKFIDSLLGGFSLLNDRRDPSDSSDWPREHVHINHKFSNIAGRDGSLCDQQSAHVNNQDRTCADKNQH